jgi:Cu(I)/Ag(I) efflux system periplasmic protein CusF
MKRTGISIVAGTLLLLAAAPAVAEVSWTRGEVKKVDLEQGKVTVKHEEITSLDMPSMTMVFTTSDPEILKRLAPGQVAEFEFVNDNGRVVIKQMKE